MTTGKLPAKPDPVTGLPRPPAAPLDGNWGSGHRRSTNRGRKPPDPPPGQGPTLEWTTSPWKGVPGGVAFMVALGIVFLTLRNGGIDWATSWVNWLIILIITTLGVLFAAWSVGGLAAGAEWIRYGKDWVRTYELTDVRLGVPRSPTTLVLRDTEDREFSMGLTMFQKNPDLWNLVYNGILHSVHYGGATINDHAREKLMLDPDLHLIDEDDSRGGQAKEPNQ
jgi:hypothetical protein